MSTDEVRALSSKIDGISTELAEIQVMLARLEERQVKAEEREHPRKECEHYFSDTLVSKVELESLVLRTLETRDGRAVKKFQLVQLIVSLITALASGGVIIALVRAATLFGRIG